MAINYIVQAEVVDITADTPCIDDAFLVDTNVWYWLTYPNFSLLTAVSSRPPEPKGGWSPADFYRRVDPRSCGAVLRVAV